MSVGSISDDFQNEHNLIIICRDTSWQQSRIFVMPSFVRSSARSSMLSSVARVSASIVIDIFRLSNSFSISLNSAGAPALPEVKAVPIFHAIEDRSKMSPMDGMPAIMVV